MIGPQPFGPRIFILDGDPVRMLGIPFATRMTIVQLASGDLWLHSPVVPSDDRIAAVAALGEVAHLVAPNKLHSLGIAPWKRAFPEATVWVSPGFKARHPALPADATLGDEAPPAWAGEIDQLIVAGSTYLDEVAFCHRPSRTLILTDLIQKHDPRTAGWFWRLVKRAAGVLGETGGVAHDLRATFRDRAAAGSSIARILAWDFDQLVIAHGQCLRGAAKRDVERAFSWL